MSYFGSSRGKPSFFSDPLYAGLNLAGFDPTQLQSAIDANATAPAEEKRGFGDSTLGKIIGILGDGALGFVGQPPAYGNSIDEARQRQQKMMEEYEQRQRERRENREDTQWEWQNKPKDPYLPDAERQAQYYEGIGDPETAADIRAKARMVPVQQADPNTGEVRYQYVRPTSLMGGGSAPAAPQGDLPRPSSASEAAKLPPGSWFIAPDGSRRQVPGGAGTGAPRTFPRPY